MIPDVDALADGWLRPLQAQRLARMVRWGLAHDPGWTRAVFAFNFMPAGYAHPAWLVTLLGVAVPPALLASDASSHHLSQALCERLRLPPVTGPRRREWTLALLGAVQLERLARHVSAAAVSASVARSMTRADVQAWKGWLGTEAHAFALTGARLMPFRPRTTVLPRDFEGVSAEAFGQAVIARSVAGWPAPLRERFLLKLAPQARDSAACRSPVLPEPQPGMVAAVLRQTEPAWCLRLSRRRQHRGPA